MSNAASATPATPPQPSQRRLAFLRQASAPLLEHTLPTLVQRWLHANDVGKEWNAFSLRDSRALEHAWVRTRGSGDGNSDQSAAATAASDGETDRRDVASSARGRGDAYEAAPNSDRPEDKQHGGGKPLSDASAGRGDAERPQPDAKGKGRAKEDAPLDPPDPDTPLPVWRVPVAQDHLYEVDLRNMKLHPVFYKGKACDVLRGTWFFDASKLTPCTDELAEELESMYISVRPWLASYADELRSSVSLGAAAETKLRCKLQSLPGNYVIFLGPHLARIYAENVGSRITKTIFTMLSGEHGGGTLVARGFDNARRLLRTRRGELRDGSAATTTTTTAGTAAGDNKKATSQADGKVGKTDASQGTPPVPHHKAGKRESAAAAQLRKSLELLQPRRSEESAAPPSSSAKGTESPAPKGSARPNASTTGGGGGGGSPPSEDGGDVAAGADVGRTSVEGEAEVSHSSSSSSAAAAESFFSTITSRFGGWSKANARAVAPSAVRRNLREAFDEATAAARERRRGDEGGGAGGEEVAAAASAAGVRADEAKLEGEEDREMADADGLTGAKARADADGAATQGAGAGARQADTAKSEEDAQAEEEEELRREEEAEKRPLELILVIHGIGQGLAEHWKSLDFTRAVSQLRKNLHARNKGHFPALAQGRRVQCLPVLWRATMDDLEQGHDPAEDDVRQGLDNRFTLDEALGRDAIPIVKQLFSGALSDIPLYMGPRHAYFRRKLVLETNRIWRLWVQRNPNFLARGGRVHVAAHSLGACLTMDVLSEQPTRIPDLESFGRRDGQGMGWDTHWAFDVCNVWFLGSPAALFLWMNRKQIIARRGCHRQTFEGGASQAAGAQADDYDDATYPTERFGCLAAERLWNVYAASDPIGTRLNPCVDAEYAATLKARSLAEVTAAIVGTVSGAKGSSGAGGGGGGGGGIFTSWMRSAVPTATRGKGSSGPTSAASGGAGGGAGAAEGEAPDGAGSELLASSPEKSQTTRGGTGKASYAERRQGARGTEAKRRRRRRSERKEAPNGAAVVATTQHAASRDSASDAEMDGKTSSELDDDYDDEKDYVNEDEDGELVERECVEAFTALDTEGPKRGEGKGDGKSQGPGDGDAEMMAAAGPHEEAAKAEAGAAAEASPATSVVSRERLGRARRRFLALNPLGTLDFVIPPSLSLLNHQYMELLYAHSMYWSEATFADFVLATVFAPREALEEARRALEGDGGGGGCAVEAAAQGSESAATVAAGPKKAEVGVGGEAQRGDAGGANRSERR